MSTHYQQPGVVTRRVMNPLVAFLTRRGLPLAGSAVLGVPGRTTGEMRTTPVNPLTHDGVRYLRAYLKAWAWEVGAFFEGVGADASDEELVAIADRHPVFVITG